MEYLRFRITKLRNEYKPKIVPKTSLDATQLHARDNMECNFVYSIPGLHIVQPCVNSINLIQIREKGRGKRRERGNAVQNNKYNSQIDKRDFSTLTSLIQRLEHKKESPNVQIQQPYPHPKQNKHGQ